MLKTRECKQGEGLHRIHATHEYVSNLYGSCLSLNILVGVSVCGTVPLAMAEVVEVILLLFLKPAHLNGLLILHESSKS